MWLAATSPPQTHLTAPLPPSPQNEEYLNSYGTFLAENGPREVALEVLSRAVELFPDHGYEKYM